MNKVTEKSTVKLELAVEFELAYMVRKNPALRAKSVEDHLAFAVKHKRVGAKTAKQYRATKRYGSLLIGFNNRQARMAKPSK
ncbi:hypothetical protein IPM19_01820 [bacterium]|nr:MAG: hypothetical protein IPM19_01820 [bacterium]